FLQRGFIRQIEPQRRNRDHVVFHRPSVRTLFSRLQRRNSEPIVLTAHRVFPRNDGPVIQPHRLPSPNNIFRALRKIYVVQRKLVAFQQQPERLLDEWLKQIKVRLRLSYRRAQRNAFYTEKNSLLRCCKRTRMPHRSEEHTSELQSRENLVCRLLLEKKKPNTR